MLSTTVMLTLLFFQSNLPMTAEAIRKKAIIIGASSGMGKEVAKLLSKDGYEVGLAARRAELLQALQSELPGPSHVKRIDVANSEARKQLAELIAQMGRLDLMVISVSAYLDNRNSKDPNAGDFYSAPESWAEKERTLDVTAKGFIAMADVALEYFRKQKYGHLVGISSTSGLRGAACGPEYSAAKACISTYMEAQRNYMAQNRINVHVTDIVPGWVAVEHSPLGADPNAYWEITVEQAGKEIVAGIKAQKKIVYVPAKVWVVALLLKYLPGWVYNKYLPWI